MCNCGCRGWCSCFPIQDLIAWSVKALGNGVHPSTRHDGGDWQERDAERAKLAGSDIGVRGVCLFLKGDWSELVHTHGFAAWNDAKAPCPLCTSNIENLYELRGFSALVMPSPSRTMTTYNDDCNACEIDIDITEADAEALRERECFTTSGTMALEGEP